MSEPVTPLAGASFDGLVRVTETGPQGMIVLRCPEGASEPLDIAAAMTGTQSPALRRASVSNGTGLLWMSPDERLILVPRAKSASTVAEMQGKLAGQHALVADVSDARAMFRLEGDPLMVREVLAKLAPVDMRPDHFEVGEVRRTRLAQVAAAFWLEQEGTAHLICFRSVARYVYDLLCTAAVNGSAVKHF